MFAPTLLAWYDTHRRDLPWRNISDPYLIWVSEIILQQTRVAQGHDYYVRFVKAFPTVQDLASASEDAVLRQWQGLGYYSRARNLHAAAKQVVQRGGFPTTLAEVRQLKGVGDYTAAAICSFAFGLPCAVVDGNVYRVLSRYFGIDTPIDTTQGKKTFAALAQELLPAERSADYNQGLMDFGATQCVPQSPDCQACPLAESCAAQGTGRVSELPVKAHKTKVSERFFAYVRIETPEGVWLRRRTGRDIWKGLYEYPFLEFEQSVSFEELLQHPFVRRLPQGGVWKLRRERVKHVLTHRILWIDLYSLTFGSDIPLLDDFRCVPVDQLSHYAVPQILKILSE